jgi:putative transcriptional regulator
MNRRFANHLRGLIVALATLAAWSAPASAADPDGTVMLVATPALSDPIYRSTVLIARPMEDGRFMGFIINKPTKITLAQAFPEHGPSKKVPDPIFLGGPERMNTLFALVKRAQSPGKGSLQLTPDLHVVLAGATVDEVIENDAEHARFLFGVVVWQPGELDSEIKRGAWYVEDPQTDLMMRKETSGLWKELVQRLNMRRGAV